MDLRVMGPIEVGILVRRAAVRCQNRQIALEVDELQNARNMRPMIRTSYYRSAFQLASTNDVRYARTAQPRGLAALFVRRNRLRLGRRAGHSGC